MGSCCAAARLAISGVIDYFDANNANQAVRFMPNVTIFAFDDVMATGVTGPIEMLNIANIQADIAGLPAERRFSWTVVSLDGKPVRSSAGFMLPVDAGYGPACDADIIMLPGFNHRTGRDVVSHVAAIPDEHIQWLRQRHAEGKRLCGICSGTFILAEAELLDGRRATTSWWLTKAFRRRYPMVDLQPREVVTDDDGVLCGASAASWSHVCLQLIRGEMGDRVANACAGIMLVDPGAATQAMHLSAEHLTAKRDEAIERAIGYMREHLERDLPVTELAARAAMSERTFLRRFREVAGMPPGHYLQRMRIDRAKQMLEHTDAPLERIVEAVGYRDVSSFRRLFTKEVGVPPRRYRERYALRSPSAA